MTCAETHMHDDTILYPDPNVASDICMSSNSRVYLAPTHEMRNYFYRNHDDNILCLDDTSRQLLSAIPSFRAVQYP